MYLKKKNFLKRKAFIFPFVLYLSLLNVIPAFAVVPDARSLGYYAGDAHVHTKYGGIDAPGLMLLIKPLMLKEQV